MPDDNQQRITDELLELEASPIHQTKHQTIVDGRLTNEIIDETGIGNHNDRHNRIARKKYIADCGHLAELIAGRCHFCDALVCRDCVALCFSCGLATCPPHRVIANFDGSSKIYCRTCAEEIKRGIKLRAWGNAILAFFIKNRRGT